MAATNVTCLDPARKAKVALPFTGTGAIAATDVLVTDTKTFPLGSTYYDTTNRVRYTRIAVSTPGVIGDWAKSAADTVAT